LYYKECAKEELYHYSANERVRGKLYWRERYVGITLLDVVSNKLYYTHKCTIHKEEAAMSEALHLAEALPRYFTHEKMEAFVNFIVATDGLTAAQAAQVPAEGFNSIWAITNHIWFWQEAALRTLRGQEVAPELLGASDWKGWPAAGDASDDAAWRAARERALVGNAELAAHVASLDGNALDQEYGSWGKGHNIVQVVLVHNAYHTCEIISVRHMQGLWLERS
jgi:hypothetical protein